MEWMNQWMNYLNVFVTVHFSTYQWIKFQQMHINLLYYIATPTCFGPRGPKHVGVTM
jgi:hypothetical protein